MSSMSPDEAFDAAAGAVLAQLRRVSDAVDTARLCTGPSAYDGLGPHVGAALGILHVITRGVDQLNLSGLLATAIRADHAAASASPAQLLDAAATALSEAWLKPGDGREALDDDEAVRLAEAVLRGVGVLRGR